MFSFQEATGKLSEPYSCFRLVTSTMHIALSPKYIGNIKTGIREELNSQLKFHSDRFNGVLIAYSNLKFLHSGGRILDDQPWIHYDIQGEFIIFQPTIGSVLKGIVNKIGPDFIGCLVHECFNASVPKLKHSEFEIGETFTFEVANLFNQHGVASFQGRMTNERRDSGHKRKNTSSLLTEDTLHASKRRRTTSENTSTPMPGRVAQPFNPGVSFLHPQPASSRSHNSHSDSIASDITIDSGLGGGASPVLNFSMHDTQSEIKLKKLKRKRKHKDGQKSMDVCDSSILESSCPSPAIPKKKRHKEKRNSTMETSQHTDQEICKKEKKHKKLKKHKDKSKDHTA